MRKKTKTEYPMSNIQYSMMKEEGFDLKNRLIDYAVRIVRLSEALPATKAGDELSAILFTSIKTAKYGKS